MDGFWKCKTVLVLNFSSIYTGGITENYLSCLGSISYVYVYNNSNSSRTKSPGMADRQNLLRVGNVHTKPSYTPCKFQRPTLSRPRLPDSEAWAPTACCLRSRTQQLPEEPLTDTSMAPWVAPGTPTPSTLPAVDYYRAVSVKEMDTQPVSGTVPDTSSRTHSVGENGKRGCSRVSARHTLAAVLREERFPVRYWPILPRGTCALWPAHALLLRAQLSA